MLRHHQDIVTPPPKSHLQAKEFAGLTSLRLFPQSRQERIVMEGAFAFMLPTTRSQVGDRAVINTVHTYKLVLHGRRNEPYSRHQCDPSPRRRSKCYDWRLTSNINFSNRGCQPRGYSAVVNNLTGCQIYSQPPCAKPDRLTPSSSLRIPSVLTRPVSPYLHKSQLDSHGLGNLSS